jgi:hypothetical protein
VVGQVMVLCAVDLWLAIKKKSFHTKKVSSFRVSTLYIGWWKLAFGLGNSLETLGNSILKNLDFMGFYKIRLETFRKLLEIFEFPTPCFFAMSGNSNFHLVTAGNQRIFSCICEKVFG